MVRELLTQNYGWLFPLEDKEGMIVEGAFMNFLEWEALARAVSGMESRTVA